MIAKNDHSKPPFVTMQSNLLNISERSFLSSFVFRFFAVYFVILILPFPIGYINHVTIFKDWYYHTFGALVVWIGHQVFHLSFSISSHANGSGDKIFNYVQVFVMFVPATIIAIVWSAFMRKRKNADHILHWTVAYIRFYFALIMMRYGLEKVIKEQFPFPYYSLNETYGQSSPLSLMWSFMGYSTIYNLIIGSIELMAGFLILFRRTMMLGAFLSIGILSNIVVLNFCFDVPVKLFALNFLLMAIFVVMPYTKRLSHFFLLNKTIPAVPVILKFRSRRANYLWYIFKFGLALCIFYSSITLSLLKYSSYGDGAFKMTPLFGIYNIKKFVKNGDTLLPLLTDTIQWKMLNIIYKKQATIKLMNDSMKNCYFITDTINKIIKLSDTEDTTYKASLSYSMPDSIHLLLKGILKEDSVVILMQKQDLNKYRLINRGFHWINEYPYKK